MARGKEATSARVTTLSVQNEMRSLSPAVIRECKSGYCVMLAHIVERSAGTWRHPVARSASDPSAALDLCRLLANTMLSVGGCQAAGGFAHQSEDEPLHEESVLGKMVTSAWLINSPCHALQDFAELFTAVSAFCRMCFLTKPDRWFMTLLAFILSYYLQYLPLSSTLV